MASPTSNPTPSSNLFLPGKSNNPLLWTCTLCATTVNLFALSDHAVSRSHLVRVAAEEKRKTGIVEDRWFCGICKVGIVVRNKEEHLASWRHMVNVRETETVKEEENKDFLVFDYVGRGVKRTTFYCLRCRSEFPRDEWEEHLNSAACQVSMEKELDGPEDKEEREGGEEKEDHQEGDYVESLIDCPIPGPQPTEAAFLCVTCDCSFPLSAQPLHTSRWSCPICHLVMHKYQKDSHIATLGHHPSAANDDWHCDVCNRTYRLGGKIGHEKGGKHLKRLQSIKDDMTTAPAAHANTDLPDEPAIRLDTPQKVPETDVASEAASDYLMLFRAHETTSNDNWYCEPCGKTVNLIERERHESSATHQSKVSEKANITMARVKAQHGKQPPNTFLCLTCNCITPLNERLQHLSPAWHCNVCDQDLHLDWKGPHLERHEVRGEVGPERQEQPRYEVKPVDVMKEKHSAEEQHQQSVGEHDTVIAPLYAPTRNMTGGDGVTGVEAASFAMADQSANFHCEISNVASSPPPSSSVFTCTLCHLTMSINNKASHLGGKKHREALRTAEEDKMQESAYCGFCKTSVLETVELHLASDAHRRAIQSAVPGGQTVNESSGETRETFRCEVCEQTLFVADREKHLQGAMHADAVRPKKAVGDVMRILAAETEASRSGALSHICNCDFCNVNMVGGVETHMASMLHKKVVRKAKRAALSPISVQPLPPNAKYYCDICSRNVFTSRREEHLTGTIHDQALDMASRRVKLEANLAARGDGMHQSQGVSASPPAVQAPVQPLEKASAQRFFCNVCNTSKPIRKQLGHEKSKKHKKNLLAHEQAMEATRSQARIGARSFGIEQTWKEVDGIVKAGVGSVPVEEDSKDVESTATSESQPLSQLDYSARPDAFTLQSQSSTARLYCNACERQLNTPTGFVAHMQGKTHRTLLEAKIALKHKHPYAASDTSMGATASPDIPGMSVTEPALQVQSFPTIQHPLNHGILGQFPGTQQHLQLITADKPRPHFVLRQLQNPTASEMFYCSSCNTFFSITRREEHLASQSHLEHVKRQTEKTAAVARSDSTSGEPDLSYCTSCDVRPKDMARHVLTKAHRIKMPDYKPPDGKMFCELCRAEYPLKQRIWHLSALWECDVCEKRIHIANREGHLKGAKHAKREAKKKEMMVSGGVVTLA